MKTILIRLFKYPHKKIKPQTNNKNETLHAWVHVGTHASRIMTWSE
jgi:hypothetical protein